MLPSIHMLHILSTQALRDVGSRNKSSYLLQLTFGEKKMVSYWRALLWQITDDKTCLVVSQFSVMEMLGVLPEQIGKPEVKTAIDKFLQTHSKLGPPRSPLRD